MCQVCRKVHFKSLESEQTTQATTLVNFIYLHINKGILLLCINGHHHF